MKSTLLVIIFGSLALFSCNNEKNKDAEAANFQNKGHELIYNMTQKVGDYEKLSNKKDVIYTYTYLTPDGKKDVSTEKYLFEGELSYGEYETHERTFADLEGQIEQGYDGVEYWLKHNGNVINDSASLKTVSFKRPTNFYWFTMFQKLLDPGLKYEHLGEKSVNDKTYDIVKISFDSKDGKPKDIYQLYINKESGLADQFLFTVADHGVLETPLLMQVEYEKVDGILIPNKRRYKKSTWDAEVTDAPWIDVSWTNIKFDNGLSKDDFKK